MGITRGLRHKDPTVWFLTPKTCGIPETMVCRILMGPKVYLHLLLAKEFQVGVSKNQGPSVDPKRLPSYRNSQEVAGC